MSGVPLIGRQPDQLVISRLLDRVPAAGGTLVVRGDPGIGKSTLLGRAQALAEDRGMRVVAVAGVQSEANLPFAGLHRLLLPMLAGVDRLPQGQAEAVRAALGLAQGSGAEPFLIAMGVLGLCTDEAAGRPLALLVDDAHWLDRASADAMAFVGRRIDSDPIILLAALREGYDSPLIDARLPELPVGPLSAAAAAQLLDTGFQSLSPEARARVLRLAEGNPLALLELPKTLGPGVSARQRVLPALLPVTDRVERSFAARAQELPAATRTILLAGALDDGSQIDELFAASGVVNGVVPTVADLVPAIEARLIEVDGLQISFRHPLVRSAIAQAATAAERHSVHAALAATLASPDRSLWHRAAAALGTDARIATELEQAAQRSLRRGALPVALAALERGAVLAPDAEGRARLLLQAATVAAELGRADTIVRLLRESTGLELGTRERARWMSVEDAVRVGPVGDPDWLAALTQGAQRAAAEGDDDAALDLLVAAASRCYLAGLPDERWAVLAVADSLDLDIDADDQRVLYVNAFAAPIERGGAVRGTVARRSPRDDAGELYLRGMAACLCGAIDRAGPLLAASTQRMREEGRLRALARALSTHGWAALMGGDLVTAAAVIEESLRLCGETMQPEWLGSTRAAQASVAALHGDRSLVERIAGEIEPAAVALGVASQLSLLQYARGLLEVGYGRHAEAWAELRRIADPAGTAHHELSLLYAIADVGEAAARTGHRDEGLALVAALDRRVTGDDAAWPQAVLLYAKAQLADDDTAEALYVDALSRNLGVGPLLRARFNLTYGEWLRRHRRLVDSRRRLRGALTAFNALRLPSWAERARRELRAAGESDERPVGDRLDEITPQELQIVRMAAGGLSNREIADRLYLSHRTVESHLYRAFPKLGVTSRAQLRDALDAQLRAVE